MNNQIKKTKRWYQDTFDDIIDVRSPSEFNEDHIVGSINFPVLYDHEREEVGKTYKNVNPFQARIIGSSLTAFNIANHIKKNLLLQKGSWKPLIYCWRGGQRSKSIGIVFSEIGWRVTLLSGGYKKYRTDVINQIDNLSKKLKLILISGKTGTAKTKILQKIKFKKGQILDLENLANHKGSLLGKNINEEQPTQKYFESLILSNLRSFNLRQTIFVEAESSKIGNIHIPDALWKKMLKSKKVHIEAPIDMRIKFLLNDYNYMCLDEKLFDPLIIGLKKRLNEDIIKGWKKLIEKKEWKKLTKSLLEVHYDPAYNKNFKTKNQQIIKVISLNKIDNTDIDNAADIIINI